SRRQQGAGRARPPARLQGLDAEAQGLWNSRRLNNANSQFPKGQLPKRRTPNLQRNLESVGSWELIVDSWEFLLVGSQDLPEAQRVDVAEHRRSWRQQLRLQEVRVERELPVRRCVDVRVRLVDADHLARRVETDERPAEVNDLPVPILEHTHEVVH